MNYPIKWLKTADTYQEESQWYIIICKDTDVKFVSDMMEINTEL